MNNDNDETDAESEQYIQSEEFQRIKREVDERTRLRREAADERERLLRLCIAGDEARGEKPRQVVLEADADYKARLATWHASPTGVEALAKEQALVASAKQAKLRNRWQWQVDKIGVPLEFANLLRSPKLRATDATAAAKRGDWRILVMLGNAGTGKTVAAAAWVLDGYIPLPGPDTPENTWQGCDWKRYAEGRDARDMYGVLRPTPMPLWVSAARLARWERYKDEAMDKLFKASKLVIDDIGAEFNDEKDNFLTLFGEVVTERLANGRPIVITSNATFEEFRKRYDGRIVDRVREHGRFVSFAGESMRRRQEKPNE